jgi:hypothetical protein
MLPTQVRAARNPMTVTGIDATVLQVPLKLGMDVAYFAISCSRNCITMRRAASRPR